MCNTYSTHLPQIIGGAGGDLVLPKHQFLCYLATHAHPDARQHLLAVDAELIFAANLGEGRRGQAAHEPSVGKLSKHMHVCSKEHRHIDCMHVLDDGDIPA